ncbi:thermonuclease family protein [Chroococcidiopsis sp.]|uniref:thermonuclease family protein n=1 Tax=Chroococcidiopsis sp. TaxID=3088168 RepID=UPI003F346DAF
MKRWIVALPILAIAFFLLIPKPQRSSKTELPTPSSSPQSKPSPPAQTWQVVKVADGDTITVTQGDRKEKIRFCGVDAPERKHGNQPGQPLGNESKANLQRLIDEANGQVQLSFIESDRYGRQVAEVFAGNKFLQEEQVKAGFAYHYARYSGNCPHRDAIVQAEAIAQSNHYGVWGGNYEKPWDYRKKNK